MATTKNYYKILGVLRDASDEDIERSWREWRRDPKNHPDSYTDPKDKERAQQEFQDRSAAYLVLSNSTERAKHDDELDRTGGGMPKPKSSGADTHGDGNGPDPSSEQADWGDGGPSGGRDRKGYARPFKSYSATNTVVPAWKKYLRLTPLLIVAAGVIVLWIVFILVQPRPSLPSDNNGPVAGGSPEATATPNPTPTPSTPSPTPTPTPMPCPGGAPDIINVSSNGSVVTGEIENNTSSAVQVDEIGFYAGKKPSTNNPPDWTDTLSNMSITPNSSTPDVVPSGSSVTFTESSGWPGANPPNNVSVILNYPDAGGQMQPHWSWVDLPAGCQQND